MKSLRVCFLIFLLLEALWCEGCWREEREALLDLRFREQPGDCCEWEGVHCNPSTGRVAQLDLLLIYDQQYINYSDFSVFKDLKNLSLSSNTVGCVGDAELPNLQLLSFNYNYLDNATTILLSCLDGLPSLKSLYLSDNKFSTSSLNHVFESVSRKLRRNLEVLDISWNPLTNEILPSLEEFTSLKELYLCGTELDSDLHFDGLCSTLRNLEVLYFSYNNFNQTDIGSALIGFSSLKSFYLDNSALIWRSIYNISKLSSLEFLDLYGNNLNESGSMLRPFKDNQTFKWPTNLRHLDLRVNSLSNRFVPYLRGLPHLQFLDLSCNQFQGELDINGQYFINL
ncbi:receptor-like protein 13 [Vigna umbellata]|uniref:receptor-like protein 13 n=1 Tax=Vigna umbellata TaxID=87088 RepID=UPI001F5E3797|nr:receptor-like protein 13 [Vigna umbellata]